MTSSAHVVVAPAPKGVPRLRDVAVRIVTSLVVAVAVPTTLFWVAMVVFDVQVAIILALAWILVAFGVRRMPRSPA